MAKCTLSIQVYATT